VAHFNDKDYFTDEQLESAKALLEADDLYSREKLSEYAHTVSFWWASTGIDQVYPKDYERAQTDLEANTDFHGLTTLNDALALDVLDAGMHAANVPTILVNEPMLISSGHNSDVRYNFFYPRWAYDEYRQQVAELAAAQNWHYLDLWDLAPAGEFTNSAIHLTPSGEALLTTRIAEAIQSNCK